MSSRMGARMLFGRKRDWGDMGYNFKKQNKYMHRYIYLYAQKKCQQWQTKRFIPLQQQRNLLQKRLNKRLHPKMLSLLWEQQAKRDVATLVELPKVSQNLVS